MDITSRSSAPQDDAPTLPEPDGSVAGDHSAGGRVLAKMVALPPLAGSITELDHRRRYLLHLPIDQEDILYGGRAIMKLLRGEAVAEANAELRVSADWFGHPHPDGREQSGECDFVAIKLVRAFYLFSGSGLLETETLAAIESYFTREDFCSYYQSENHALLFHSSRHLMAAAYPTKRFHAYGETGAHYVLEDATWLKHYLRHRARCGWGEFDSSYYIGVVWECLTSLFDFSADEELRQLARRMLDLTLADFEVDCLNGRCGGAQGRIYPRQALDHSATPAFILHYLYFGAAEGDPLIEACPGVVVDALSSLYRPDPIIRKIALDRSVPYENRERRHLHNVADTLPVRPIDGSIRKYTWWTPDFVMGCVQYQDAYPEAGCPHHPHHGGFVRPEQRNTAAYDRHQQHDWDLSFAANIRARIFTHHPGNDPMHNYWTGDHSCKCGHFFQNRSALVALYNIRPDQSNQFIHAYLPREAFDEIVEEANTLYLRSGRSFAALTLLPSYRWTSDGEWKGREVISEGPQHGVVCEAGTEAEFGSFQKFRQEIKANPLSFDADTMELAYHSHRAGHLWLNTHGGRELDGKTISLDYPTHGSPYVVSEWKSGIVKLTHGTDSLVLDFNNPL